MTLPRRRGLASNLANGDWVLNGYRVRFRTYLSAWVVLGQYELEIACFDNLDDALAAVARMPPGLSPADVWERQSNDGA